jgi:Fe-S-cluster containining protein
VTPHLNPVEKLPPKHTCRRSGICCIIHWGSFEAVHEDIIRWRSQGRQDILRYLSIDSNDPQSIHGFFTTKSCPFLKRDEQGPLYSCTIQDTKPFYCRLYPDDGVCEYESPTKTRYVETA